VSDLRPLGRFGKDIEINSAEKKANKYTFISNFVMMTRTEFYQERFGENQQ